MSLTAGPNPLQPSLGMPSGRKELRFRVRALSTQGASAFSEHSETEMLQDGDAPGRSFNETERVGEESPRVKRAGVLFSPFSCSPGRGVHCVKVFVWSDMDGIGLQSVSLNSGRICFCFLMLKKWQQCMHCPSIGLEAFVPAFDFVILRQAGLGSEHVSFGASVSL